MIAGGLLLGVSLFMVSVYLDVILVGLFLIGRILP